VAGSIFRVGMGTGEGDFWLLPQPQNTETNKSTRASFRKWLLKRP